MLCGEKIRDLFLYGTSWWPGVRSSISVIYHREGYFGEKLVGDRNGELQVLDGKIGEEMRACLEAVPPSGAANSSEKGLLDRCIGGTVCL